MISDVVRWIVLTLAIVALAIDAEVVRRWLLLYRSLSPEARTARLRPGHVVKLAMGSALLLVAGGIHVVERVGKSGFVWKDTPIVAAGVLMTVWGQWDAIRWLPRGRGKPIPLADDDRRRAGRRVTDAPP